MILIGRRALVVLGVIVLLATGFLGVYGYRAVVGDGAAAGRSFSAQQFLYVSLLVLVLEAILFVRVMLRSRNIGRELDKLIEITRFRGLSKAQNLDRLGPIGKQIGLLYEQLNSLSERKTLKISSLSELTEFLMNNISAPALATTVDGTVVYVSRTLTDRLKRSRNEVIDSRLEELAPGIVVAEVVAELDRSHSSIQRKSERGALSLYPIRNVANQLAYIVCVFQGNSALVEQAKRAVTDESRRRSLGAGMQRILDLGRSTARRWSNRESGGHRPE